MGGEVVLPATSGTITTGPLKLVSGLRLVVDTMLLLEPGSNDNLLTGSGCVNLRIEGMGLLHGNRSVQTVKNFGPPPWSAGIRLIGCVNGRVSDLEIGYC